MRANLNPSSRWNVPARWRVCPSNPGASRDTFSSFHQLDRQRRRRLIDLVCAPQAGCPSTFDDEHLAGWSWEPPRCALRKSVPVHEAMGQPGHQRDRHTPGAFDYRYDEFLDRPSDQRPGLHARRSAVERPFQRGLRRALPGVDQTGCVCGLSSTPGVWLLRCDGRRAAGERTGEVLSRGDAGVWGGGREGRRGQCCAACLRSA